MAARAKSEGSDALVALLPIEGATEAGARYAYAPGDEIDAGLLTEGDVARLLAGPDPAARRSE